MVRETAKAAVLRVLASGDGPWEACVVAEKSGRRVSAVASVLSDLKRIGEAQQPMGGLWVGHTSRWWGVGESGLSVHQVKVLRYVAGSQVGLSSDVLAKHLGVVVLCADHHLRRLRKRGLALDHRRPRGSALRTRLWRATEEGQRLAAALPPWPHEDPRPRLVDRLKRYKRSRAQVLDIDDDDHSARVAGHIMRANLDGRRVWVVVELGGKALTEAEQIDLHHPDKRGAERLLLEEWHKRGLHVCEEVP